MKIKSIFVAAMAAMMTACSSADKVEFKEAEGYFFKNGQPSPKSILVMRSKEELEKHFGYAATMSRRPTEVDFSKQAVIAIVLPEMDIDANVRITGIANQPKGLKVDYKIKSGKQLSYTIQPMTMVVIDKAKLKGTVTANQKD